MTASLDTLKAGQSGVIVQINGGGAVRRHLLDMGLTPDTKIVVKKIAPFGTPIEIAVRQYKLSIGKSEARNIIVDTQFLNHFKSF